MRRLVAFDEVRIIAVAAHEVGELVAADPREDGRVGDLEAIEVEDRQHGAVARGVEELVRMPAGRQRAGFRLAVSDHAGDDQIGVVIGGAKGMGERIA
jgi:hypothetical protein